METQFRSNKHLSLPETAVFQDQRRNSKNRCRAEGSRRQPRCGKLAVSVRLKEVLVSYSAGRLKEENAKCKVKLKMKLKFQDGEESPNCHDYHVIGSSHNGMTQFPETRYNLKRVIKLMSVKALLS
ncbi:MAG: hypothetical protein ACI8Z5_002630 [Lentimonas sp.]|jgi:hypothetical protein